jgi:uncharacterized protein YndB with AHSA1/START domain
MWCLGRDGNRGLRGFEAHTKGSRAGHVIAPRPGDGTVAAGRMVRSVATAPVDHGSYCRCMRFEATIDIAARVEHVFAVYTDVEHWPDWTRSVTSVERLDPGSLRVGSRARIRQPRLPVAVWEVTDLAPGRSFTWMARGPGIVTTGNHVVKPVGGGDRVTVTASLEQGGVLGPLVGLLTKRLTNRYLDMEVNGLKAHCET